MAKRDTKVCLGTIVGAQGVRGAVRIRSETEIPEDVASYGTLSDEAGERRFEVRVIDRRKGVVTATIKGIGDRDAAEALKGIRLYVERERLPAPDEDEFYHADLIGLVAETVGGERIGTVRAVFEFGAGDVLEVADGGGRIVMVPFTKAIVPTVDIESGRLIVDPPRGLLEADKDEDESKASGT